MMEETMSSPEMERETCMICGEARPEGLHILEEFICLDCERELVRTDVQDEKYPYFIHQMKQVWHWREM